jgi:hypothetical protein
MPHDITDVQVLREHLTAARLRAGELQPFSPAWDAAMTRVEDLERQLWSHTHSARSHRFATWAAEKAARAGTARVTAA